MDNLFDMSGFTLMGMSQDPIQSLCSKDSPAQSKGQAQSLLSFHHLAQ